MRQLVGENCGSGIRKSLVLNLFQDFGKQNLFKAYLKVFRRYIKFIQGG